MDAPAVSNDAFLKAKLHNFVEYLKTILKKHLKNARYAEFEKKIQELDGVDTANFIVHVLTDMSPYKSNVGLYVAKLLKENDVEASLLTPDELTKLGRYVTCFIEVAQQ